MAKCWRATSLVALALLCCFYGTKSLSLQSIYHPGSHTIQDSQSLQSIYHPMCHNIQGNRSLQPIYHQMSHKIQDNRSLQSIYNPMSHKIQDNRSLQSIYHPMSHKIQDNRSLQSIYHPMSHNIQGNRNLQSIYHLVSHTIQDSRSLQSIFHLGSHTIQDSRSLQSIYHLVSHTIQDSRSLQSIYHLGSHTIQDSRSLQFIYHPVSHTIQDRKSLQSIYHPVSHTIQDNRSLQSIYHLGYHTIQDSTGLQSIYHLGYHTIQDNRSLKSIYHPVSHTIQDSRSLQSIYNKWPHYPPQRTLSSSQQYNGPSQLQGKGYAVPRGFADQPAQNSQHAGQKTGQQPSHPNQPNVCDVANTQRVPCGSYDISAAGCEAISCCYDSQQCYFGKSVTVQCTKDGQFIVVVAKECTVPVIDLETVSLIEDGQGCTHVDSNSAFFIYQFPVTRCGTVIMEDSGVIVYENRMTSMYEVAMGPLGAITRDTSYNLLFQCRYTGTSVETFIVEVQAIAHPVSVASLGPMNVELRLANGQCNSKGCVEEHVAYSSFYTEGDYPVTKILRDPVYAEVRLIGRTDPNLVLSLGRCWTTTSANPHSLPQWDILIDGCPNRDDRYKTTLVPVSSDSGLEFLSHYKRFIFQMFTFVDPSSLVPQREHVYIHCSTSVCNIGAGYSCEPMCFRLKRDVDSTPRPSQDSKVVVSSGPVVMSVR
ncbi:uncharacterized protein [Nerophis lumbriciformis]|uniref:uncharacterized protein n=1 Tax=Nerophis lumbriciformis TaxID=546530 RepID=UPI003BAA1D18